MSKSQKTVTLASKLAGKNLIGFDTSAWGKAVTADAKGSAKLAAAKIGTKVGTKPPTIN